MIFVVAIAAAVVFTLGCVGAYQLGARRGFKEAVVLGIALEISARAETKSQELAAANKPANIALVGHTASKLKN